MIEVGVEVEVEEVVRRYGATPRWFFSTLRRSGAVPLDVVERGALEHPNPSIRWQCVQLLDHLGDDSCAATLVAALRDPVPRVRRHAVHALSCTACKERPLSLDVLPLLDDVARHDPNAKVRAVAGDAAARLASCSRSP